MSVLGLQIPASEWYPERSVIGKMERSGTGNVILRVGRVNDGDGNPEVRGWHQTEHVVLTPDEALDLIARLARALKAPE
jgi:hypothetical protein